MEDHRNIIISSLFHSQENINLNDGIPKLTVFANHDEWYVEDIEWGITNQVVFQIRQGHK